MIKTIIITGCIIVMIGTIVFLVKRSKKNKR